MSITRNQRMHLDTLDRATADTSNGTLYHNYVALFTNDITPSPGDSYSDYELVEATGLTAQAVDWQDISDDNENGYKVVSGLHQFRRGNDSDPAETAVGYIVYRLVGYSKYMRFAERFENPVLLETTLDSVSFVLQYGEGLETEVSAAVIE